MAGERILVVDDEPGVRAALEAILVDEGFRVTSAESGEIGLQTADAEEFDAILLDVWLPGIDGLETLRQLRERNHEAEVVMISGHGTIETAVKATKLGAFDFIEKPLSLEKTLLVLRNALRQRRLQTSNRRLLEQLSRDTEIIGTSSAARRLRENVRVAAATDAPVLIGGEQGSGRETVARRLHAAGRHPDGPFVEVPCGALDPVEAERVLYGEQGAGGRITMARAGSLFLEDVERLDRTLQRRLAATLVDEGRRAPGLRAMASAPRGAPAFDADLVQFLDVVRIDVPSLRERREDIALLAERRMRQLSREYGKSPKRLAPDCLAALRAYAWPGNIRQLANLVERLLLFVEGETVTVHDLPQEMGGVQRAIEDLYGEFESLAAGVRAYEHYVVGRALTSSAGDEELAARRLGIAVGQLREKLRAP